MNLKAEAEIFLDHIKGQKVLVVGDVMIDQYLEGSVSGISPEASVPILMHDHTQHLPGGAANVALNLAALSSEVWLASVVGQDDMGNKLIQLLNEKRINTKLLLSSDERLTTCKTRVMAGKQHLLRVDKERAEALKDHLLKAFISNISTVLNALKFDLVIMQDYNKGVLSSESIRALLSLFAEYRIPVAVDPKFENFFEYEKVDLFKPNLAELRASTPFEVKIDESSLAKAADYLREKLGCKTIMITLSDKGIYINRKGQSHLLPAQKRIIADVCGAGDTVISVASLALSQNLDIHTIAFWAGYCGTVVCQYPGVVPVSSEMILIGA